MTDTVDSDSEYEELLNKINEQFPDCPFSISCIENIEELDSVFSNEPYIYIYDNRATKNNNYYLEVQDKKQFRHYLKITRKNNQPITLRQVLLKMSKSKHYNDETIRNDFHNFLESFDKRNNSNIYVCSFGS